MYPVLQIRSSTNPHGVSFGDGAPWLRRQLMLRPLVVCLAMVIVVVPSSATAQEEDDFRSEARMRLGALYLTPSVVLTNLGVDTNVFNAAGERQQDFTFSLSPHVDAWLPFGRRTLLETSVTLGIDYYQKFESERSFNPDVRGRFSVIWNRLTLFAEGGYLNTRERPSFEIDVRSRRVVDGLLAGAELEVFRKLFVEVMGGYERTNYAADAVFLGTSLAETLNRDERSASMAVKWRATPLMTAILASEVRTYRFQLSPDRDADSVSATIGAELHPRALVSGSGYVGVKRFVGLDSRLPDYSGVVALASVSYTFRGSTVFTYTAERDVVSP